MTNQTKLVLVLTLIPIPLILQVTFIHRWEPLLFGTLIGLSITAGAFLARRNWKMAPTVLLCGTVGSLIYLAYYHLFHSGLRPDQFYGSQAIGYLLAAILACSCHYARLSRQSEHDSKK
jgi:hypothetical protein